MDKKKVINKKKILYFTDSHGWGGAENYLVDLVTAIDREKYDLEIIFPNGSETNIIVECFTKRGIPLDWVDTSNNTPFLSFIRSCYCFIYKRPDLVHFNLSWPPFCRYPILAASLLGRKIVLTEHLVPHNYILEPYEKFYKKLIYSRIFQAIAVSADNKLNLLKLFGVPEKKLTVIHNGIDVNKFQFSIFKNLDNSISCVTHNKTVITTISRLVEHKGLYFLIQAAKHLNKIENICFLIVGEGPLQESLMKDVKEAGMEDRFLFIGFRSDIPYILSKTDIFVLPSLFEGLPISVLEAMAAGKPVIASNVSGIPEEVIDKKTGILVPPGDPEALAKAIEELAKNPEKRQEMGEEGRKLVKEHFTLTKMVYETEKIYQMAFQKFKKKDSI
jgi:glycosyltransferase involved in cell wall biosynthesis